MQEMEKNWPISSGTRKRDNLKTEKHKDYLSIYFLNISE